MARMGKALVCFTPGFLEKIDAAAEVLEMTRSELIRAACRLYVDNHWKLKELEFTPDDEMSPM